MKQVHEQEVYKTVVSLLKKSKHPLFITGAGISADSGLPTYRGIGGLYDNKHTDEGIPIETALSGPMMLEQPAITWKYLLQIRNACRSATFNKGHTIIAEVESQKPDTWVLTQNVDGYHRDAGSKNLIEIHGNMNELYCMTCMQRFGGKDIEKQYGEDLPSIPHCLKCNGILRPEVVLFGEMLPQEAVSTMQTKALVNRDLIIIIGTTAVFPYISQPVIMGRSNNIPTVEINPSTTMISDLVEYRLEDTAAKALERLWG